MTESKVRKIRPFQQNHQAKLVHLANFNKATSHMRDARPKTDRLFWSERRTMKIVDEIEDNYSGKFQDDAISEACPIEAKFSSSEVPVGAKVLITPEKSPFSPNS